MAQFISPRPQLLLASKLQLKLPKPRNPLVGPGLHRQAGRHGPSTKAMRQQAQTALRHELQRHSIDKSGP